MDPWSVNGSGRERRGKEEEEWEGDIFYISNHLLSDEGGGDIVRIHKNGRIKLNTYVGDIMAE